MKLTEALQQCQRPQKAAWLLPRHGKNKQTVYTEEYTVYWEGKEGIFCTQGTYSCSGKNSYVFQCVLAALPFWKRRKWDLLLESPYWEPYQGEGRIETGFWDQTCVENSVPEACRKQTGEEKNQWTFGINFRALGKKSSLV